MNFSLGPPGRTSGPLLLAILLLGVDWCALALALHPPWLGGFATRALLVGLCVWFLRRESLAPEFGCPRRDLGFTVRVLAACATVLLGVGLFLAIYLRRSGGVIHLQPASIQSLEALGPYLVMGCLQAPICEELIYRGWIQRELRGGLGPRTAVFLSGILFWISHWWSAGGVTPINQLVGGWVIAWSYERTRSLTTAILLHAAGNLALACLDLALLRWPAGLSRLLQG